MCSDESSLFQADHMLSLVIRWFHFLLATSLVEEIGSGSENSIKYVPRSLQDNQLARHMIAAKVLEAWSSRQQTEHPGADAKLLAVACSQLDPNSLTTWS